jgi:hypothetical protein
MKVFLSWSGERSQAIAEALREWLPKVIQAVTPWMSAIDVERGARWSSDIAGELSDTSFGILCITPENLNAPWIHFEAGALSKTLEKALVCPYLFEVEPTDLEGPLVQFNAAKCEEDDTRKLILTINEALETPLPLATIQESFDLWWPKLQARLQSLPAARAGAKRGRPEREILEEVLELVRGQVRSSTSSVDISDLFDSNTEGTLFQPTGEFVPGTYVKHIKYGRGLVLAREGKGERVVLRISFPGFGQKKIIERFAGLSKAQP